MRPGILAAAIIAAMLPASARGQLKPAMANEARLDARFSSNTAIEAGWSLIIPAGYYVRTAVTGAGGYATRDDRWSPVWRFEMVTRFLLDPFREHARGLSVGGGAGITDSEGIMSAPDVRGIQHLRWRPYIIAVVDLETKKTAGWTPAVQVGLGGGARIGLLLRSGTDRWR